MSDPLYLNSVLVAFFDVDFTFDVFPVCPELFRHSIKGVNNIDLDVLLDLLDISQLREVVDDDDLAVFVIVLDLFDELLLLLRQLIDDYQYQMRLVEYESL